MGKSLVIVESPAKAKTINKYLGNQYVVKSSIGHIRDLPTSGSASAAKEPVKRGKAAAGEAPALSPKEKAKRQLVARMGVDPEHGWKAKYEILPGKEKVVEELRRAGAAEELKVAWAANGAEFPNLVQQQFGSFVSAEIKRWATVVKDGNIKLD